MKILIALFLLILALYGNAQSLITISKSPQEVPDGKKWILPTNRSILVELSDGAFTSGHGCNANLLSNPRILGCIVEGEYGRPNEVYTIIFRDLEKVHYTNDYTYSIIPIAIVDSKFTYAQLRNAQLEEIGIRKLVFYAGQKVYISQCLQSIQVVEYNLNKTELIESNKRKIEEEKKKEAETERLKIWKEDKAKRQTEDSVAESIRLNTFPRLIRYKSVGKIYDFHIEKNKKGKLKIFCDDYDKTELDSVVREKIEQLLVDKSKGEYIAQLRVTDGEWEVSKGVYKELREVEVYGELKWIKN